MRRVEAQLGLGGPGGRRGLREPVALVGGRLLLAGLGAGVVEALLQGGQLLPVADQGAFGGVDGLLGALGLAAGGPDRGAELAEPLGHRRHPGVGLVQPLQRVLDARRRSTRSRSRAAAEGETGLLPAAYGGVEGLAGVVDGRLHLDQAGRGGAAAAHDPGREARHRPR